MSWMAKSITRIGSRMLCMGSITVQRETIASQRNVATVLLQRSPVNSFNLPFASQLTSTLKELEDSDEVDAIIIKSLLPNVFSAGLDLHELYGVSGDHLESFWLSVQDLWFQIYSSKMVTLSLINGHCLAAGTIIAAACDYRVACEGDYKIGVTAAKVGLVAPPWFLKMLSRLMGERRTEHVLQVGRTFTPSEAVEVGLIDQVCSVQQAGDACLQALSSYLSVYQESRRTMKQYFRAELIDNFEIMRHRDKDAFVNYVMRESVQKQLGTYIQQMKGKK